MAFEDKLQEKRDLEEKLFTAQTRAKSLEQRCQELSDRRFATPSATNWEKELEVVMMGEETKVAT